MITCISRWINLVKILWILWDDFDVIWMAWWKPMEDCSTSNVLVMDSVHNFAGKLARIFKHLICDTYRNMSQVAGGSFLGYFFSSTNTKTIFWSIKTTNCYRIRPFWPQIPFFPRSFEVQFSAASDTPPSVFGPSTPPGNEATTVLH